MGIPTGVNYPTTLDSNTTLFADPTDQVDLTLAADMGTSDTSFQVNEAITTINVPTFFAFATGEIVYAEAKTDGTKTFSSVTRATIHPAHSTGEHVRQVLVSNYIAQLKDAIVAIETELGYLPKGSHTDVKGRMTDFENQKAAASGLASLDGSSLVVQNPANATATATASKIPISDSSKRLDTWVTKHVELALNGGLVALTTSDKAKFIIPAAFNGMSLKSVKANLGLDGSSGSSSSGVPQFSVQKQTLPTTIVDMLSTNLTVDQGEYDSSTAATAAVIKSDGSEVVATNNIIWVEVVAAGTGVYWAIVALDFGF